MESAHGDLSKEPSVNDHPSSPPASALLVDGLSAEALVVQRVAFDAIRHGERLAERDLAARCAFSADAVARLVEELASTVTVVRDHHGAILGIAGLSLTPTSHQVRLDGVDLFTWCAYDAVGIPASLRIDAQIATRCPTCATPIEITFRAGKASADVAAVAFLPADPADDLLTEFCQAANLFCGEEHLTAWRHAAGDPLGQPMTFAAYVEVAAGSFIHLASPSEHSRP